MIRDFLRRHEELVALAFLTICFGPIALAMVASWAVANPNPYFHWNDYWMVLLGVVVIPLVLATPILLWVHRTDSPSDPAF